MVRLTVILTGLSVAVAGFDRAGWSAPAGDDTEQAGLSPAECDPDVDDDADGDDWAAEVPVEVRRAGWVVARECAGGAPADRHAEEIGFPPWSVVGSRRS